MAPRSAHRPSRGRSAFGTAHWRAGVLAVLGTLGTLIGAAEWPTAVGAVGAVPMAPQNAVPVTSADPWLRRSAGDAYNQALHALHAGDRAAGEAALRRALQHDPRLHAAREALATVLEQDGRREEAVVVLREGLELAPEHAGLRSVLAHIEARRGNEERAIELLRPVAEAPAQLALLAVLYQRQGRPEQAAAAYLRALREVPEVAAWWVGLGIALEGSGQATAPEAYRRALRLGGLDERLVRYAQERLAALEGGS